jgi:uncharacterized membrane protein (DUF441 family)
VLNWSAVVVGVIVAALAADGAAISNAAARSGMTAVRFAGCAFLPAMAG